MELTSHWSPNPRLFWNQTFWPEINTFIWLSQRLEHVSYSSVKVIKTIATNDVCLKCLVSSLIKVPLASNKKEDLWYLYSSPPAGGVLHYFNSRSSNFLYLWNSRVAASLTGSGDDGTSTPDPLAVQNRCGTPDGKFTKSCWIHPKHPSGKEPMESVWKTICLSADQSDLFD